MTNISDGNHLIVFVKNPVAGKVKTRLAKSIGNQKALEAYLLLLSLTRKAAEGANCTRHVFYSDDIVDDEWSDTQFSKHLQIGSLLGEKMQNAFTEVFALGAKRAIIIGSDCPEISAELIDQAFEILTSKNATIGPAKDGGYYLLGMNQIQPSFFADKQWSTDTVFEDTVVDLMENRLTYGLLPKLSDVDTIYDLHLLKGFGS
ncbi:MAG: rSAM/selenodomain-associated transferase 1 [Bacteroidia bacterium]|jgi:rSAM/selenodomain-associated transferase 1